GFVDALSIGYAGVQMGTRFIATHECQASEPYKQAIVDSEEDDIVLTERLTGVPVAVINTPYVERLGLEAGPIAKWMLRGRRTKHFMRSLYALRSAWTLKRTALDAAGSTEYWQAGRSVADIHEVVSAASIVNSCAAAARAAPTPEAS
ncbi:MAG: nitronate monooxygenase, partial [Gemmatimonadota bacterium]|nr:nitronate monooxygenase [Gemmatimonadota bacterium]